MATPVAALRGERPLEAVFGPEPVTADFAVGGGGLLTLRPRHFEGASADLVAARAAMPSFIERYGAIDVPVGILFGTGDRILDPEVHGRGMRSRIPGLKLELVEGGHMLPLTQPDRVAELVREVALEAADR